jgi:hypothetical protein
MSLILDGSLGTTFNDGSNQPAAASPYVLKNRIINGDCRIDQRNAGASVTPTNGAYVTDRWKYLLTQTSKLTSQQSTTAANNYTNSLLTTSSSAYSITSTDAFVLQQFIEGFNVADLGWGTASAQTVTLSFWVRSSLTGTFGGALTNSAIDRSYPFSYTISAANTWEQKSVTIAGDTSGTWLKDSGIGIRLSFGLGVGSTLVGTAGAWSGSYLLSSTGATSVVGTSGATFYITGVQLEVGSSATPFERRLYNQELANCQRYYTTSFDIGVAPANTGTGGIYTNSTLIATNQIYGSMVYYAMTMRTTPTISLYNLQGGTANQWQYYDGSWKAGTGSAAASINTKGFHVELTSGTLTNFSTYLVQGGYAASAEL